MARLVLLLVTKAHPTIARLAETRPWLERLAVPKDCSRVDETAALGIAWAADNAAFSHFDEPAYVRMIDRLAGVPGCRFVAAPDVVGDAATTLALLERWLPELRSRGLPVGLVAQDGLEPAMVPWDDVDAIFVGGSTGWKLGPAAELVVVEAKKRGRWVHMGRVNTLPRIAYAKTIGCDSVDGSQWSLWTSTWIADAAAVAAPAQPRLSDG